MIIGLDTSVLVRLLAGDPRELALEALRFLVERRESGDRLRVSELVLAETYYALQHHYGASKRNTLTALREFLATSGVEGGGDVAEVLATPGLATAKPGFIDRLIHAGYLRSGVEQVATFEQAAAKLPAVLVLTPAS